MCVVFIAEQFVEIVVGVGDEGAALLERPCICWFAEPAIRVRVRCGIRQYPRVVDAQRVPVCRSEFANAEEIQGHVNVLEKILMDIISTAPALNYELTNLSAREKQICAMVKIGLSSKEIANMLNVSVNTVLNQRTRIRKKLGIPESTTNLVTFLENL